MKLDAHPPLTGRKMSALGLAALVSCFMAVGTTEAGAKATTSSTQAQKLSKALKACKKQPRNKRALCVKRAKKRYATHPAAKPPSGSATTPTGSTTAPTAPVTPPAGPGAPPAPTFAEIERWTCSLYCPILNFSILERGVPRLGSGVSRQRGGDDVPSDTWIFPLLLSYDKTAQLTRYISCPLASEPCYPGGYNEPYTMTYHWRERTTAQLAVAGTWTLHIQASTETCEPVLANCGISWGGGA